MSWEPGALLSLTTRRFIIRSMTREDVTERFLGWLADPGVMVGLNLPRKRLSRLQAVRWVLGHDNRSRFFLAVCPRPEGEPIGFFTVVCDNAHNTAETSVVIGERDWWGKDVVKEARTALLDFLFDTLRMHKVIGRPHGRNFSSIYNYQVLGFRCEAVLREQMRAIDGDADADVRLDQLIFGMLRSEWQARRQEAS
jgi:RimJ/RimL family protein N-acetyltransferase